MNWHEVYLHMKAGTALDEMHQRELSAVLEKYPFFALGRVMMAKVATKLNDPRAQQLRFLGALYAPSRQHYAFFLEEKMRPRVAPPPRTGTASRESHTPSVQNEKKDEQPASGEEPGPVEMPYSESFLPSLQGWIAARLALYGSLGRRLRTRLTVCTDPETAPPVPSPPQPPLTASDLPVTEREPPSEVISDRTPDASPVAGESSTQPQSSPQAAGDLPQIQVRAPVASEGSHLAQVSAFSPLRVGNILQFELPLSRERRRPAALQETLDKEARLASPPGELPLPSDAPPALSGGEPSDSHDTPPTLTESPYPSEVSPSETLQGQFHRSYIPLEEMQTSVHLASPTEATPVPEATTPPVGDADLREQFHRSYVPLEGEESVIHLSPEGSEIVPVAPEPETFPSESPIRSFVPLDIDVEASIHLPVPEPTGAETADIPPAPVMTEGGSESISELETKVTGGWQSFLAELQKELPLPQVPSAPASKELEGLRREFIRRLLARRLVSPDTMTPHQEENLIDLLLQKLEAFQPQSAPPVEGEVPELTIPGWETAAATPRVYTETMARLYWSQGDIVRAIQVYEALIEKHPDNADHYRRQIERIRSGEMP